MGKPGRVHAEGLLTLGDVAERRCQPGSKQLSFRSLAPRYEKVLQEVYNPAGTTRDFTGTCTFPLVPASEFKQRLNEMTLLQAAW